MADTQFLRLSKKWALAYDNAQWIVQRRKAPGKKGGECRWANVAFVASRKDVLLRVLREKGTEIEPDAQEYLHAMPHTFREWISMPPGRRFKTGHRAIIGTDVDNMHATPERSQDRAKKYAA